MQENQTSSKPENAEQPNGEGVVVQRLVSRCADCQHWSGNEYPPAYEKAYCEIFDKDTPGNHGSQCTAFSPANREI